MQQIGKLIHMVDVKLKRNIDSLAAQYNLTSIQFIVMECIYLESQRKEVFQRDLEKALDVRRSTISNGLGILEKKGYVRRESVHEDARLKKLLITPAGIQVYQDFKARLERAEAEDFQVLSKEELNLLIDLLERLCGSLA
ncbi:MAG: MarR family transcriptional regulator [Firmicutes bacterium]|jgi:DNA-binding MarR family transcriptional regulator|nr:MarR family transcriptional regulator [Bacillota bacterium]NBI63921.1 MarR family transcriptional regulator [Clostridiales bacterium]